jgi:hypothetical protein
MNFNTPFASYSLHDNGIHEFIFKNSLKKAADDIFAWLDEVYRLAPADQPVLILADTSNGLPPVNYMLQHIEAARIRQLRVLRTRVAYLYSNTSTLSILGAIFATMSLPATTIREFDVKNREAAITWLLNKNKHAFPNGQELG